jgi:exonuclease SbcD
MCSDGYRETSASIHERGFDTTARNVEAFIPLKLFHAADLHVDSPLRGLEQYDGAPVAQLRNATRRALERLVDSCLQEEAAVLLLAGDIFDGDWRDYSTGLFFAAQMARLREGGTRVVMLRGNHDAQSQISKDLRLPENVHDLHTRRPESVVFEDLGLAVHGQGFATREVTEDLAARYPAPTAGFFNVGLLHTSLTGRPGHEPYAPSTLEVLRGKGYDYWALGHVHTREVVSEDPWVVFPGNLQGRHMREPGAKGATVVTIQDSKLIDVRHEPFDTVRWGVCPIDAAQASDPHDVVELVRAALTRQAADAGGRLFAARVVVSGRTRAHARLARDPEHWTAQFRACAFDVGDGSVWLERVLFKTQPESSAPPATREDALGQLLHAFDQMLLDPGALLELGATFSDLKHRLPALAGVGEDGVRFDDPAFLAESLEEARELLLARLLEQDPP